MPWEQFAQVHTPVDSNASDGSNAELGPDVQHEQHEQHDGGSVDGCNDDSGSVYGGSGGTCIDSDVEFDAWVEAQQGF